MSMKRNLKVNIELLADTRNLNSEIASAEKRLEQLQKMSPGDSVAARSAKDLKEYIDLLKKAERELISVNDAGKKTDIIGKAFRESGKSVDFFSKSMARASVVLEGDVYRIKKNIESLKIPINTAETALSRFGKTAVNSLRYNVVNSLVDSIKGGLSSVKQFHEQTDKNLNNIRIVTGKTNSEMVGFMKTAQTQAKAYGIVTNDYLKASELYYQQGLANAEVAERTTATIMAANIAQQDVGTTADQITAVLNGFDIAAKDTIVTLDKMAALGAGTATDFEEIAKAAQKTASSASEAGMGLDETLAMISTISSITREAPEAVGTSLNSIIGRFNALTVEQGEAVGEYTSKIQKAFEDTNSGLSIFDENKSLKDRSLILTEVAGKWESLDRNQKASITTAIAGTRQANKLSALLGNWDQYESYLEMSRDSAGALEEQNDIYLSSLQAVQNELRTSSEIMWGSLFDATQMKGVTRFFVDIVDTLGGVTANFGGLLGMVGPIASGLSGPIMGALAPSITKGLFNAKTTARTKKGLSKEELETQKDIDTLLPESGLKLISVDTRRKTMSDEQNAAYNRQLDILERMLITKRQIVTAEKLLTEDLTENREILQSSGKLIKDAADRQQTKADVRAAEQLKTQNENIDDEYTDEILVLRGKAERLKTESTKTSKKGKGSKSSGQGAENARRIKAELLETEKELKEAEKIRDRARELAKKLGEDENAGPKTKRPDFFKNILIEDTSGLEGDLKKAADDAIEIFKEVNNAGLSEIIEEMERISILTEQHGRISLADVLADNALKDTEDYKGLANKLVGSREYQANPELFENSAFDVLGNSTAGLQRNLEGLQKKDKDLKGSNNTNVETMKSTEKSAKISGRISSISQGAVAAAASINSLRGAMDSSATAQQRMTSGVTAVGSALSIIPGYGPAISMAVNTLGPLFIEVFGIGVTEAEKLDKQLKGLLDSNRALTESIKTQAVGLRQADDLYAKFGKMYKENPFTVQSLSDEDLAQYQQLTEYIEVYAPELIKHYDEEGRAVLDLSESYKDLDNNQKGYLRNALEISQLELYSSMSEGVGEGADVLLKRQALALEEIESSTKKIAEIREKASITGKVNEKLLEKEETRLQKARDTISSTSKDWDSLFTTVITKGTPGFSSLSEELQNSLISVSSYSSFLDTNFNNTTTNFEDKIRSVIMSVSTMGDEALERFKEMSSGIQEEVLKMASSEFLTGNQSSQFLQNISQESFLEGSFLPQMKEDVSGNYKSSGMSPEEQETKLTELQKTYDEIRASKPASPVYGNYNNSEIYEYGVAIREFNEELENAQAALDNFKIEMTSDTKDAAAEMASQWKESMRVIASSSDKGFNDVLASFNTLVAEMDSGKLQEGMSLDDYQEATGAMYAALQGDNVEYYQQWKENNFGTLQELQGSLGVYSDNYKTYNEYMSALDEQKSKLKVLYEIAAAEGSVGIEKKLFEFKKEAMLKELGANGKFEDQALLLVGNTAKEKQAFNLLEERDKIKSNIEMIKNKEKTSQEMGKLSEDEYNAVLDMSKDLFDETNQILTKHGMMPLGYAAKTGKITFNEVKSQVLEKLESDLAKNEKALDELRTGSDYESALNSMTQLAEFEKQINALSFKGIDFESIKAKDIKTPSDDSIKPPGGDKPPKKEKEPKEPKEVADLKLELDPLKIYTDKVKDLTHETSLLKKERENLYGAKYIDSLNKEANLNKRILETEQAKLAASKKVAATKRAGLGSGVKYDENGLITNYNELLKSRELATNSLTGEAKEAAKEGFEEFKKMLDEYEKYALDVVRDTESSIQNLKSEMVNIAREKLEYPITLIVKGQAKDMSLISFLSEVDKFNKGEINFSVNVSSTASSLESTLKNFQDMIKQGGTGRGFLNSIMNDPSLKGNVAKQLEMIETQSQNMQDLAKTLMDFGTQFRNAFKEAIGSAVEILNQELAKYSNITNQYQRLLEIAQAMGTTNIPQINDVFNKMEQIQRTTLDATKKMSETIKKSRDSFDKGSEEWTIANEKYLEAQGKVLEQEKALADLLSGKFDAVKTAGRKELEDILFNGGTSEDAQKQLNEINRERSKYLDTERKVYELYTLEQKMLQEMKKYEADPKARSSIKKFMDAELKHLQSKEKLTQNDLNLTEKQYDVIKSRIELERARENENYVMQLQRNADGSFSQMFVQDTKAQEEAEQSYRDSIDQLYQYSMKRTEELQQEGLDLRNEGLTEYDDITAKLKAGTITQEEAVLRLNKAFENMNKRLKENAREQAEMQKQVSSSKLLQLLGVTENELGGLDDTKASLLKVFDILAKNGEATGMSQVISKLGLDSKDYIGTTGEQMAQLFEDIGGDSGALKKLMTLFGEAGNSTAGTILALLQKTGDLSIATEEILNASLTGSGEKFDEYMNKISSGEISPEDLFTESINNGLTSVSSNWTTLQEMIGGDLDDLVKEFDISNPDSTLGLVTANIFAAYESYNKSLEDAFYRIVDNEQEWSDSTEDMNENLESTIEKIKEEIEAVTEATQKYAGLRTEILAAIAEIGNYVGILEEAKKKTQEANKTKPNAGSSAAGSGSSSSGSTASKPASAPTPTPAPKPAPTPAPAAPKVSPLGIGSRVKLNTTQVYVSSDAKTPVVLSAPYSKSDRTDLRVSREVRGRYLVSQNGKGDVGWFNPKDIQAFHTGGRVGVNPDEGLAVLQKGEHVLTSAHAKVMDEVRMSIESIKSKSASFNTSTTNSTTNETIGTVHMHFPDVSNSDEIMSAFQGLSLIAKQRS